MKKNIKTTIRHLTQATILASLFVASSAQAAYINTYNFCPDGTSHTKVMQYEYILEPTQLYVSLSLSGGELVQKSKILQPNSWFSVFNASQSTPVSHQNQFFYHMVVISEPGFANLQHFHSQSMKIKDIVPNFLTSISSGAIISMPGCMAVEKYMY